MKNMMIPHTLGKEARAQQYLLFVAVEDIGTFSSHVDYNDFDVVYEVLDEDTGDFDSTTVTFNYRKWDVCYPI